MENILLITLTLLFVGGLPAWRYSAAWGYYPSAISGTLFIVLLILYQGPTLLTSPGASAVDHLVLP